MNTKQRNLNWYCFLVFISETDIQTERSDFPNNVMQDNLSVFHIDNTYAMCSLRYIISYYPSVRRNNSLHSHTAQYMTLLWQPFAHSTIMYMNKTILISIKYRVTQPNSRSNGDRILITSRKIIVLSDWRWLHVCVYDMAKWIMLNFGFNLVNHKMDVYGKSVIFMRSSVERRHLFTLRRIDWGQMAWQAMEWILASTVIVCYMVINSIAWCYLVAGWLLS